MSKGAANKVTVANAELVEGRRTATVAMAMTPPAKTPRVRQFVGVMFSSGDAHKVSSFLRRSHSKSTVGLHDSRERIHHFNVGC
jgi:hypothetical protein